MAKMLASSAGMAYYGYSYGARSKKHRHTPGVEQRHLARAREKAQWKKDAEKDRD